VVSVTFLYFVYDWFHTSMSFQSSKIDICYVKSQAKFGFHRVDSVEGKQGHEGVYVYPVRFDDMVRIETFDMVKYIEFINDNPLVLPDVDVHSKVELFYSKLFKIAESYKDVCL